MAEMSRIHEALGVTKAPRTQHTGGPGLSQLGWAPGSRTTRRRERRGLGDYLLRGILIGGLVWIGWWMGISRDESVDVEPAVATGAVGTAPAEAPVEPVVLPVETPGATIVSADVPSVPEGESRPDAMPAPTGPREVAAARIADGPAAPALPVISAILLSEGRRLAVVEGRVLGPGQRVGSWELVSVDRSAVVLRDASGAEQIVTLDRE